jgi:hypothetical protein
MKKEKDLKELLEEQTKLIKKLIEQNKQLTETVKSLLEKMNTYPMFVSPYYSPYPTITFYKAEQTTNNAHLLKQHGN